MVHLLQPSTSLSAFNCPFCGVLTTQHWHLLFAEEINGAITIPTFPTRELKDLIAGDTDLDDKQRVDMLRWIDRIESGLLFFDESPQSHFVPKVYNIHLSECYNCKGVAIWRHDQLVWPSGKGGAVPNSDLPLSIKIDFEEARGIVNESPRGAAALLRLCVQKLCKHLGERGKNIDDDISALVAKGLNPLVQQSLDIVRVIGNEAVHPGILDLNDDRDAAIQLFNLVNTIADQMISHPKAVQQMYEKLPEAKRRAIENRDRRGAP